jgi:hypothetical protein
MQGSKPRDWFAESTWTVAMLKQVIIDKELGTTTQQQKQPSLDLRFNTLLEDHKTLAHYGITSSLCIVFVITKVLGGALAVAPRRRMNTKHEMLRGRGTLEPDCINGEKKAPRARLTCGCAVCAETAFNYIVHSFSSDPELTEVLCPNPNCKKTVPWPLIACIAALTEQEFVKYTRILKRRQKQKEERLFKLCPFCQTLVAKPDQLNTNRVRCIRCSKADFCFCCCKPWKNGGMQVCGNEHCATTRLQKELDSCETTNNFGKPCPVLRACPQCLALVQWKDKCRHINCPNKECKYEFCLVCLQKFPCSNCQVAGRQKLN